MLSDTDIKPMQELTYLRKFTQGQARQIVDSVSRRLYDDPKEAILDVWDALDRRFGNPAAITHAQLDLLTKSAKFGENDSVKLQAFSDVCLNVSSQMKRLPGLACLNYANVLHPVITKLPRYLRFKWEKIVASYAESHADAYPDFHMFTDMIVQQSRLKNHPNIHLNLPEKRDHFLDDNIDYVGQPERSVKRVFKSNTKPATTSDARSTRYCLLHDCYGHDLTTCFLFENKSTDAKNELLERHGMCTRCVIGEHKAVNCNADVKCTVCKRDNHCTLLHQTRKSTTSGSNVQSTCTAICNSKTGGMSCSKVVLVDVYSSDNPKRIRRVYAIHDDQSNASLITPELADDLMVDGKEEKYLLSTCSSQKITTYGRRINGLVVQSVSGTRHNLPSLLECENIPQDKREVATPAIARRFPHLRNIATEIPPFDKRAEIMLLIGRDAPELLKVRGFKNGPPGAPWGQQLLLGWTISGQVCLDRIGGPVHVRVHKTSAEDITYDVVHCNNDIHVTPTPENTADVFRSQPDDDDIGLSQEDRRFISIMDKGYHKNSLGNCEMPLPFKEEAISLPDNRRQALSRLNNLQRTLARKPKMKSDYIDFMTKMFDKGHAHVLTETEKTKCDDGNVWYLPHFGVYNIKKPEKIRVVFDSSAEFHGVSLNKVLLTGPDSMNKLLGVLIRFRKDTVAIVCDIEQMYHSFYVNENQRNYLRFLWFANNDPTQSVIECRMNVHIFGNASSPAVATYGLRRTAQEGSCDVEEAKDFVERDFYVDDGLTSRATEEEAIDLIKTTQQLLKGSNLRLHKIASNSKHVMNTLPRSDRSKDVCELDLSTDTLPAVRTLGVSWDLNTDAFTFHVSVPDKPFTRRGVLSIINSVYDPLGLAAPVTLKGKLILQKLTIRNESGKSMEWDDPLPPNYAHDWETWRRDLCKLEDVTTPRCYHPTHFGKVVRTEIHGFSDASKVAVGTAIYLRQVNEKAEVSVSFVYGQGKVAPARQTTIPRLELCAAVMLAQAVQKIKEELHQEVDDVYYYTDSQIVLGYIYNETRRFYIYVGNRVQRIRDLTKPSQWRFIDTDKNPADVATRGVSSTNLLSSMWLQGPTFLQKLDTLPGNPTNLVSDIDELDPDVRPIVNVNATSVSQSSLGTKRFERFSTWKCARRAIANLVGRIKRLRHTNNPESDNVNSQNSNPSAIELQTAERLIISEMQSETFKREIKILRGEGAEENSKASSLKELNPFLDDNGILRVGGRITRADINFDERHPIILPKNHHITNLIIRHEHERIYHQGRTMTTGAIRASGYWVIGAQRIISSVIRACTTCRRIRGEPLTQKMADLPADRLEPSPPFTNVGFDVFGPWLISTRKLRGGAVESKRWGVVFTCLTSRAIHIEVIESMDTSAFICALRRFFAVRGSASILRCDRGTNFIGAKNELDDSLHKLDKQLIASFLAEAKCEWRFNPPHASHFGGVWERQILTIRRVLDSMLFQLGSCQVTHELLVTLMAEVTAIVNSRPITTVSSDIDEPQPLTPMMLLTMKSRPLTRIPGTFTPQDIYVRKRWRRTQYLADQFWSRWRKEYLQNLQARSKWTSDTRNVCVDDVVVVNDDESPRYQWPLARVVQAHTSEDGKVRSVDVKICKGGVTKLLTRPIAQLVLIVPSS